MNRYDPDIHKRRSIRLKDYDYSQPGAYFVTICAKSRGSVFGGIKDGIMHLTDAGRTVKSIWNDLPNHYPNISLDAFIIMPNHVHGIIVISDQKHGQARDLPLRAISDDSDVGASLVGALNASSVPTLCEIVGAFKSKSTNEYIRGIKQFGWPPFQGKLWQRNYYDHIIRDEKSLEQTREYVFNNPLKWDYDDENPDKKREDSRS